MAFKTFRDVEGWVKAKDPGGVNKLREALATGTMTGPRAAMARAWLEEYDRLSAAASTTTALDAAVRQTIATEKATETAGESLVWAKIAVGVSIIAALLAAIALYRGI